MSDATNKLGGLNKRLLGLFKADRKTMTAFKNLSETAVREETVSSDIKELVAVAIAVSNGCEDCILYHVNEAKRHGATREALVEILAVAIEMSGGPGTVYSSRAVEFFDTL